MTYPVPDDDAETSLSGTMLFGILWDELVDLLGVPATAALMRRALSRAAARTGGLAGLEITRLDRRYGYVLPPSFASPTGPPAALFEFLEALRPLLVELTGPVAVQHLERVPGLRNWRPAGATHREHP